MVTELAIQMAAHRGDTVVRMVIGAIFCLFGILIVSISFQLSRNDLKTTAAGFALAVVGAYIALGDK